MIKVVIPNSIDKIKQQILALEYQLEKDETQLDIEIHQEALHDLRKALNEMSK